MLHICIDQCLTDLFHAFGSTHLQRAACGKAMTALREKAAAYGLELYSLVCDQCWDYSLTANDPAVRPMAESTP